MSRKRNIFDGKDTNYIFFSKKKAIFFVGMRKKTYLRSMEIVKNMLIFDSFMSA